MKHKRSHCTLPEFQEAGSEITMLAAALATSASFEAIRPKSPCLALFYPHGLTTARAAGLVLQVVAHTSDVAVVPFWGR